jgi:hypothetical protein
MNVFRSKNNIDIVGNDIFQRLRLRNQINEIKYLIFVVTALRHYVILRMSLFL